MRRATRILACALLLATAAGARVAEGGTLIVDQPWTRATPGGAPVAGGYAVLRNTGTEPDRLLRISSPLAGRAEIHEMAVNDGVMTMRPLPRGLEIKPGETIALKPGGHHIMFMDLKAPFRQGERIPVTLEFERAGTIGVELRVEAIGAREPTASGSESGAHHGTAHDAGKAGR
ncbi:MAG TPA: copper chaperone PCu(A)C [Microvirga sp.]|nr:copper chaperone PCu(A)C [Microvirga sp.]